LRERERERERERDNLETEKQMAVLNGEDKAIMVIK
jgi:hypothetical protein